MKRDEFMDLVGADYVDEYEEAQLSQEDATIVAKSKRTFVELLVHYPHPDVCTYPEYKGKPYYSIKYIEDGECFVGFGTYKPEVLSQYLRDYFMTSAQPEERTKKRTETRACDLISRQAAIDAVNNAFDRETLLTGFVRSIAVRAIRDMPSAQPERKTGHWILYDKRFPWSKDYKCSECGNYINISDINAGRGSANFCPNCGADMRGERDG